MTKAFETSLYIYAVNYLLYFIVLLSKQCVTDQLTIKPFNYLKQHGSIGMWWYHHPNKQVKSPNKDRLTANILPSL